MLFSNTLENNIKYANLDADKIVVMDQGRGVEIGNHEELLARQGRYYDLYMTQFAGNSI